MTKDRIKYHSYDRWGKLEAMVDRGNRESEALEMKLETEVLEQTVTTLMRLYGYNKEDATKKMLAYYRQSGYDVSDFSPKKNPTPEALIPPEWGPVVP